MDADVLLVGGGIIGLSSALALARAGRHVVVLERGEEMREASWAAAGMLAAHDPENPPELRALSDWSLALYPEYLRTLAQLSGASIPLRTSRALQQVRFPSAQTLSREALREAVPELEPADHGFVALDEWSLDPRDLCRALPRAARAAGVVIHQHSPVAHVESTSHHTALCVDGARYRAPALVWCAGAWTGLLAPADPPLPIEPRKGQIACVQMSAGEPQLNVVLRTQELYLVPRGDGRIVVGATVEQAGFDRQVRKEATEALIKAGAALWPPLAQGAVAEVWTGLRPGTPDTLPVLGELGATGARTWVAAGHFRNGILLAPATARLVCEWVLGRPASINTAPFVPARFLPIAP